LDESLFVESVAGMRIDIVDETKSLQHSKVEDRLVVEEISVDAAQPLLNYVGVAISMKAIVKQSSPVRGFLRKGVPQSVSATLLSPKMSVASSSTLVAKEDGVEGTPSLLGGCAALLTMKRVRIPELMV
jgi:hypothetical protein